MTFFSFDSRSISSLNTVSSISCALLFTANISLKENRGQLLLCNVPKAYWIFSPSALIIWASPSSSIAIDASNKLIA